MGYIKHHTIVVTCWSSERIREVQQKAKDIFGKSFIDNSFFMKEPMAKALVSDIIEGIANHQFSFFIAPDGSKEGWSDSNNANSARKEFLDWLDQNNDYCDYFEVRFGGDDDEYRITRSLETYLNDETN